MQSSERLDLTFAALADPTRRAILARLATGEATVTELAEPFEMSQPAISKLRPTGLSIPDLLAMRAAAIQGAPWRWNRSPPTNPLLTRAERCSMSVN
jgi:hypothetical protein